ncbi:uncharacterized protein UDID_17083 [Ustilago sp. UG-2017a]|nr:uncharacterized protein UDID_17083 [Ustilago sp. UG-2017a]
MVDASSPLQRLDGRTACDQPSEASTASACNTQTQAQHQSIHTTKWETGFGSFPAKSRFLPRSPPLHPGRLGTLDSLSYTSYSLTFTALASIKRLAISSKTAQLEYRARLRPATEFAKRSTPSATEIWRIFDFDRRSI